MTIRVSLCLSLAFGSAFLASAQDQRGTPTKLLSEKATISAYAKSSVDPYLSRWIPTSSVRNGFVFSNTRVKAGTEVTVLAYRYYSKDDRSMVAKPDGKRRVRLALARSGEAEGWIPAFRLDFGKPKPGGGIVGGLGRTAPLLEQLKAATQGLWYSAGESDESLTPVKFDAPVRTGADLIAALGAHKDTQTEVETKDVVTARFDDELIEEVRSYDGDAAAEQWTQLRDLLKSLKNVRQIRIADAQVEADGTLNYNDLGSDSHFVYLIGEDASGATIGIKTYVVWT